MPSAYSADGFFCRYFFAVHQNPAPTKTATTIKGAFEDFVEAGEDVEGALGRGVESVKGAFKDFVEAGDDAEAALGRGVESAGGSMNTKAPPGITPSRSFCGRAITTRRPSVRIPTPQRAEVTGTFG